MANAQGRAELVARGAHVSSLNPRASVVGRFMRPDAGLKVHAAGGLAQTTRSLRIWAECLGRHGAVRIFPRQVGKCGWPEKYAASLTKQSLL